MKLNSNTTPNGTNSTFQHGMSKQECEQLAKIQKKLNIYSAQSEMIEKMIKEAALNSVTEIKGGAA